MTITPLRRPGSFQKFFDRFLHYLIMCSLVLIILVPVIMLVFGGLKTRGELATSPFTPPNPPQWENYAGILRMSSFWNMLLNSVFVMVCVTLGAVVVSGLAAFIFARLEFRFKNLTFNILMLGILFPMSIAILPVYLLLRQMDMLNPAGVILPQIAFGLAGNVLILRTFFTAIPAELQDAAYIDGCNSFDFFWRILLPLARPSLSAVAIMVMVGSWNEYFLPLVVLSDEKYWTLPLGTMQFAGQYVQDWTLVLAFVTLTMIPVVVFYLFAERQIISGLTAGAIKG